MNYEESSNVIQISNALPTTDETGKVRLVEGEYFVFNVSTIISGDASINWKIAAEDLDGNTFDGSNVKFYLTRIEGSNEVPVNDTLPKVYSEETKENTKTGRPANMMSLHTGSTSTKGEETTNYRLRLYVDENYNPQGDGGGLIFKSRINVYGKVSAEEEISVSEWPIMRGGYTKTSTEDYHNDTYKSKVTSIVTKKDTEIPNTTLEVTNGKENYWDVSTNGDDSVIAYIEDDGTGNGTYKLTIGGKGGVRANSGSSYLFCDFTNMTKIDLSSFNTSNVNTMRNMFNNCSSLTSLDLSHFDTINVTSVYGMFCKCKSLTNLNLSNFGTSNVTDMSFMFCNSSNLQMIKVGGLWTTANVTMTAMFRDCGTNQVTVV